MPWFNSRHAVPGTTRRASSDSRKNRGKIISTRKIPGRTRWIKRGDQRYRSRVGGGTRDARGTDRLDARWKLIAVDVSGGKAVAGLAVRYSTEIRNFNTHCPVLALKAEE